MNYFFAVKKYKKLLIIIAVFLVTPAISLIYKQYREDSQRNPKISSKTLNESKKILIERANNISEVINTSKIVLKKTEIKWVNYIAKNTNKISTRISKEYFVNKGGVYSRINKNNASNIYLRKNIKINTQLKKFINLSEKLDDYWVEDKKELGYTAWKWTMDSKTGLFRLYPWSPLGDIYGSDLDFRKFEAFNNTIPNINSNNEVRCTSPNIDYGGLGLCISCSVGVFLNSEHYAAMGLDIPLGKIYNEQFNRSIIPQKSYEFLFDEDGHIFIKNDSIIPGSLLWDNFLSNKSFSDIENIKQIKEYKSIFSEKLGGQVFMSYKNKSIFIVNIKNTDLFLAMVIKE